MPYSYVVNKSENNDSYERMQRIILQMRKEKLILGPLVDDGLIEIDIEGSRVSGKYRRLKRWDSLKKMNRFFLFVTTILLFALCGFGIYMILHKLRVI